MDYLLINSVNYLVNSQMRRKAHDLEAVLKQFPKSGSGDQLVLFDPPITHHFSKGVYGREMFIPAGTTLTGEIHKYSQFNVISMGEVLVSANNQAEHFAAPHSFVAPAGVKRIIHALEDTVWTTIHGTDLTDLAAIRKHFIAESEEEYRAFCNLLENKS